MSKTRNTQNLRHKPQPLWRLPILLALASGAGLLLALLASDTWHLLAWLGVGAPLLVIAWQAWKQRR